MATMRVIYWSNDLSCGYSLPKSNRQQDTELSDRRQSICSTWNTTAETELARLGRRQKLNGTYNFPRFAWREFRSEDREYTRIVEQPGHRSIQRFIGANCADG